MFSKEEEFQAHAADFMTRRNQEDETSAVNLETRQFLVLHEFLAQAERFGVDPEPVPHVVPELDHLAKVYRAAGWTALVLGLCTAILLSLTGINPWWLGVIDGALAFIAATTWRDAMVASLRRERLIGGIPWWWILPPTLLFVAGLIGLGAYY